MIGLSQTERSTTAAQGAGAVGVGLQRERLGSAPTLGGQTNTKGTNGATASKLVVFVIAKIVRARRMFMHVGLGAATLALVAVWIADLPRSAG